MMISMPIGFQGKHIFSMFLFSYSSIFWEFFNERILTKLYYMNNKISLDRFDNSLFLLGEHDHSSLSD